MTQDKGFIFTRRDAFMSERSRGIIGMSLRMKGAMSNSIQASQLTIASWVERTERKNPRMFSFIFVVALPFIALLCWSLLCGHITAVMESKNELMANDKKIAAYYDYKRRMFHQQQQMAMERERERGQQQNLGSIECLNQFLNLEEPSPSSELVNATNLRNFMENNCTIVPTPVHVENDEVKKEAPFIMELDVMNRPAEFGISSPSFHWNVCSEGSKKVNILEQWQFYVREWNTSFMTLYQNITTNANGLLSPEEAYTQAIANSTGAGSCKVNSAGGAIFWFTVMTTIGYGNTAAATTGGRCFVMIFGLLSILMFTGSLGAIGYVSLAIADDEFKRRGMERMTKGWLSVLFWFCMLVISMLSLVGLWYVMFDLLGYDDYFPKRPMIDIFWFAFATLTTIGFGDIYIYHETFRWFDMFIVPLFILFGFVTMANFLLKLSDCVKKIAKKKEIIPENSVSLRSILSEDPESMKHYSQDEIFPVGKRASGRGNHKVSFYNEYPHISDEEGVYHQQSATIESFRPSILRKGKLALRDDAEDNGGTHDRGATFSTIEDTQYEYFPGPKEEEDCEVHISDLTHKIRDNGEDNVQIQGQSSLLVGKLNDGIIQVCEKTQDEESTQLIKYQKDREDESDDGRNVLQLQDSSPVEGEKDTHTSNVKDISLESPR